MTLAAGTRLGPYEITSAIGAGGMGEVYKARDTRLDRTVAIKILPAAVAADPERRARFEREAKTVAGLNHAHICSLYDVGDHDGSMFLVMEHLTGETLAARLRRGPLPLEQALTVAAEIADALAAAHRQAIVHRDLKPGNVMLTKAGAKLLDFGLAKLRISSDVPALAATSLPTAEPVTGKAVVLGTVPYMAPEQLEGKEADARSDIFSFGAVLYEMLTGKRAFEGTSAVSVMSAIMEREPTPIGATQPLTPPLLDRLVRRCLAKSPDDRPDTAHDVANELCGMREFSGTTMLTPSLPQHRRAGRWAALATGAVLFVGLGLGLGAGVAWFFTSRVPAAAVVRFTLNIAPADALSGTNPVEKTVSRPSATAVALSPDGRVLVFSASKGDRHFLYARPLDQDVASPLNGSENGEMPFFSPDGRWIGFWADGALRKIPAGGGPAVEVCKVAGRPSGVTWTWDRRIVFAAYEDDALWQVWELGGAPRAYLMPDQAKGEAYWLPHALPGGKGVLYTSVEASDWSGRKAMVHVAATGERKLLVEGAADVRYVPTGHLLFVRAGKLCAVPFDLAALRVTGAVVAVADDVMQAFNAWVDGGDSGAAQLTVSDSGVLGFVRGGILPDSRYSLGIVGMDGTLRSLSPAPEPHPYLMPVFSPEGKRIAAFNTSLVNPCLWVFDLERGTLSRPVMGLDAQYPRWSPDGRWLAFGGAVKRRVNLFRVPADGSTAPERLTEADFDQTPAAWGPGGRELVFVEWHRESLRDLMALALDTRKARPLVKTSFNEFYPAVSPDGRWLAYTSDKSGRSEVYVQPYAGGEAVLVSAGGGVGPLWSRDGRQLFFSREGSGSGTWRLCSIQVTGTDRFAATPQRTVFEMPNRSSKIIGGSPAVPYDLTPDGRGILVVTIEKDDPIFSRAFPKEISIVVNWFEELRAKVPAQ